MHLRPQRHDAIPLENSFRRRSEGRVQAGEEGVEPIDNVCRGNRVIALSERAAFPATRLRVSCYVSRRLSRHSAHRPVSLLPLIDVLSLAYRRSNVRFFPFHARCNCATLAMENHLSEEFREWTSLELLLKMNYWTLCQTLNTLGFGRRSKFSSTCIKNWTTYREK